MARFQPGQSGNPAGKPPGIKNKPKPNDFLTFANELAKDPEVLESFKASLLAADAKAGALFLSAMNFLHDKSPKSFAQPEYESETETAGPSQIVNDFIKHCLMTQPKVFSQTWAFLNSANPNDPESDRILINRGGARSGKTYSEIKCFILLTFFEPVKLIVTMKSRPLIKVGPFLDFLEILDKHNLREFWSINQTELRCINNLTKAEIHFKAFETEQKAKGVKSDFFFMCESDGQSLGVFKQLMMRCKKGAVLDLNPSDAQTWVNQKLELDRAKRSNDVRVVVSTYLDNPHLPASQIREIELLKESYPESWKVYGLGEYGVLQSLVYPKWDIVEPQYFGKVVQNGKIVSDFNHRFFGIDWGFRDPMVIVECYYNSQTGELHTRELLHMSGIENQGETAVKILTAVNIVTNTPVFFGPDNPAQGKIIAMSNILAIKADNAVEDGHNSVRSCKLSLHSESKSMIREIKSYRYFEDKNGVVSAKKIVDVNNHAMDAKRYAVHSYLKMFKLGFRIKKNK